MKRYTVTRNQAANLLGVSTRTIDRYVKSGKLSYKKVANKVILNEEELRSFYRTHLRKRFLTISEKCHRHVYNWWKTR